MLVMCTVKCMFCDSLNVMCLCLGNFIETLCGGSIMRCYLYIALVIVEVVLGGDPYVKYVFRDMLFHYEGVM